MRFPIASVAIAVSSHQAKVRSRGRNPRAAGSSHWNHAAARSGSACAYTGAVAVLFVLDVRNRDTADAVLEVQRAAYASEAALIGVDELPPLRETREDIVGSREQFLGASLDGALVGVISWECRDVACELGRLVVHPRAARRGVGRALLREAIARNRGLAVFVETAAANTPAITLYRAEAFVVVRSWPAREEPSLRLTRLVRRS